MCAKPRIEAGHTFRSSLTDAYRRDLGTQMVAAYQACPSCSPTSSGEKMGAIVGPCSQSKGQLSAHKRCTASM